MNNKYIKLDLNRYYNNKGISYSNTIHDADFSGVGSSYPADIMPNDPIININNVPFKSPDIKGVFDNLDFHNQVIELPSFIYSNMYILGAAENGSFTENIKLVGDIKNYEFKLGLSEWILNEPLFGEKIAVRSNKAHSRSYGVIDMTLTLWMQKISLNNMKEKVNSLLLGDNPGMHIFSITFEKSECND